MTRDSIIWTVLIIGGGCAYLATMPAPTLWTWAQWMQTGAAACMALGAKLGNSPLLGKWEK